MKECPLIHKLFLVGFIALLASCANSEPAPPSIHPLEQDALNSLSLHRLTEAKYALNSALKEYQSLDDLAGQWRVHYRLATMALDVDQEEEAHNQITLLVRLAEEIPTSNHTYQQVNYRTNLLLGRTSQESQYFSRAMSFATTAIEQAVVKTYQGHTQEAVEMISDKVLNHPADQAFVFYQHAIATNSNQYYAYALQAYQIAQDSRGVADSLFSLAKIEADKRQIVRAREFATRALITLEATGDTDRAGLVSAWLDNL